MRSGHTASFYMGHLLINCDLGENEPDEQTQKLLDLISAANICCGVHAGNQSKMQKTLRLAAERGVIIGAHPGLPTDGGRGEDIPSPDDFRALLHEQLNDFIAYADRINTWVSYVKLHGSLYHAVEQDDALADVYLDALQSIGSGFSVFALAGGTFQEKAKAAGILVREEIFADRGYLSDGSLVLRSKEGAVLDAETALARFRNWQNSGLMETVDGEPIKLHADTICVHSDSPGADDLLRQLNVLS